MTAISSRVSLLRRAAFNSRDSTFLWTKTLVFRRMSFFFLPNLDSLLLSGNNNMIAKVVDALDRGGSLTKLRELTLQNMYSVDRRRDALHIDDYTFSSRLERLRILRIGAVFDSDTVLAVATGEFGRKIETLVLDLRTPNWWNEANEKESPLIKLPDDFGFDLPELKSLSLGGHFHATIVSAFGNPNSCPSLEDITFSSRGVCLGPIHLDDYTFPDHFLSKVKGTWRMDQGSCRFFAKLASQMCFRPAKIIDSRRFRPLPASLDERPWPYLSRLESVTELQGFQASTGEFLEFGLPPKLSKLVEWELTPSGLDRHDIRKLAEMINKIDQASIRVLVIEGYPGVDVAKSEAEMEEWKLILAEKQWKFDLAVGRREGVTATEWFLAHGVDEDEI